MSARKLFVVGIGPGSVLDRTRRAEAAIAQCDTIVGYGPYVECVRDLTAGKEVIASAMTREVERCRMALDRALEGVPTALLSSGDPGVYGMAGLALEIAVREGLSIPIEIVPGVSAAHAAAARLGAPLMLDYACISLSDLLAPWDVICRRLEAVASADLVVALYNPKSKTRVRQIAEAASIFRRHRAGSTPVGIATAVGRAGERVTVSDLDHFPEKEISMHSIVVVGNSTSKWTGGWMITPRGYVL